MSPRWATIGSAGLYFYAEEPHRRPHVDVVGPDWDVKIDLATLTELNSSGRPPPALIRRVLGLLREHQDLAVAAFEATRNHRLPGTLEQQLEDEDA